MLDRRLFLQSSGALFISSLNAQTAFGFNQNDALFIAACQKQNGDYAAAIVGEQGNILHWVDLPARGHDTVICRQSNRAIIFARRPGTFAIVIDLSHAATPQTFTAPPGRHFYGHGAFSADSKLLFTAENDYENASGIIGIYDATNNFTRLGEFLSHGIGPHEILLMPDGRTLAIANGGIETHPDYGRAKLNLATMIPSICFLDSQTGALIEQHALPHTHHQLSLRHLAVADNGTLWFAGQFQGQKTEKLQLIGSAKLGEPIKLLTLPDAALRNFQNYISSIKFDESSGLIAATSSIGGHLALIDPNRAQIIRAVNLDAASGIGFSRGNLLATGRKGAIWNQTSPDSIHTNIKWDNHLTA